MINISYSNPTPCWILQQDNWFQPLPGELAPALRLDCPTPHHRQGRTDSGGMGIGVLALPPLSKLDVIQMLKKIDEEIDKKNSLPIL